MIGYVALAVAAIGCGDGAPEGTTVLARSVDALKQIGALLHDALLEEDGILHSPASREASFRVWRLTETTRPHRMLWPLAGREHAQVQSVLVVRSALSASISMEVPADRITDLTYSGETREVRIGLFASPPIVLAAEELWVELRDVSAPIFEGPNKTIDVELRRRGLGRPRRCCKPG